MEAKSFWLFRTLDNYYCLEHNTINYGWSDFSLYDDYFECSYDELREEFGSRAREVSNCFKIRKGDILIMPLKWEGGIAIGEVLSEHILYSESEELYKKDMSNYFEVKWITEYYDRTDLPAEIQSTLKYRRSNLNIDDYEETFEKIIEDTNKGINSDEEKYGVSVADQRMQDILLIHEIISNRSAKMIDTDFERFILDLFGISFNLEGYKNTAYNESEDGKDIMLSFKNFQSLGLDLLSWNIQIKQHVGETNSWAIEQISLSDNSKPFVFNVVVSSAKFSESAREKAKEKNVILIDGEHLAEIIYDNFEKIPVHHKRKLGLIISLKQI